MRAGPSPAAPAAVLATGALAAVYAYAAFGLSGDAPVLRFMSGIFDMDVARVVVDFTTDEPARRSGVHPLQKVLVAPLGGALRRHVFDGGALAATRAVCLAATALAALLAGVLARQLAGGSRAAGFAGGMLCGASFASLLAASVPESAAVAALGGVAPLVLLGARRDRELSWGEAVAWGLLAVPAFGLTLTQGLFFAVALGARVLLARRHGLASAGAAAGHVALALAVFALAAAALLRVQVRAYDTNPLARPELFTERAFLRTDALREEPAAHVGRVVLHFALVDFVAPAPALSDHLMQRWNLDYWSLSLEEAHPARWAPARQALAAAWLVFVAFAASGLRRGDAFTAAVALAVLAQLGLHLLYGREYVLYAPHWQAPLAALLAAGAARALGRRRRLLPGLAALLAACLLANGLVVLDRVYREVEAGLATSARDPIGRVLEPAPRR